jgi:iron(III) transport system permease protein
VGGRHDVLTTEIYMQVTRTNDLAAAATMSVVLLAPCLAAYLLNSWCVGGRSYVAATAGARTALRPTPAGVRWPLFIGAAGLAGVIGVIYGLIPLGSVVRLWGSDWSLSLGHYRFASTAEGAWPVWNSVRLALLSGIAGTLFALVIAYVVVRRRPPGARLLEFLSLLPAAVPGTVIGLGYLLAFDVPPLLLAGTIWILVGSVVFWTLPLAVRAGIDALERIDPAVEEAAMSLGAGRVRAFGRVVLPLLTGTALAIFVSFFVNGMVTVSAVILLVRPGSGLASVAILDRVQNGDPGAACALGTIVLGIVLGAVVLLRLLVGGQRAAFPRI